MIIQIKNGPIDFQVREPASPLFGALEKTNQAIELQITQEYFGQARHMVFLRADVEGSRSISTCTPKAPGTPVNALVAGKTFHRPAAVSWASPTSGMDENWIGNHLSQANLYGFGRLAWDPGLTAARSPKNGRASPSATIPRWWRPSTAMQLSLLAHV